MIEVIEQRDRELPRRSEQVTVDRDAGAILQQTETAEQWINEGEETVKMARLSRHRFRSHRARLG